MASDTAVIIALIGGAGTILAAAIFKLIVPLDPPFVRPAAGSSEVTGARSASLLTDRSA